MKVIYLGHQGWLFDNEDGIVLLDAIYESMGNGFGNLGVWPNRQLAFDQMKNLKAMIISHEHWDHFNIETLTKVDKKVEIFVPELSTYSMVKAIQYMGFKVILLKAFQPVTIGKMKFIPLPNANNRMEVDVYSILVESEQKNSFLTTIDAVLHPNSMEWLVENCPSRTLDNVTNNFVMRLDYLSNKNRRPGYELSYINEHLKIFVNDFSPNSVAITGQGWVFPHQYDHFNHMFFKVTHQHVKEISDLFYPSTNWFIPASGTGYLLKDNQVEIIDEVKYVKKLPLQNREFRGIPKAKDILPYTGIELVEIDNFNKLENFILNEYGQILGAHTKDIVSGIYELLLLPETDLKPTLLIRVRNGNEIFNYEFNYGHLKFYKINTLAKMEDYAVAVEIWASDFLLMLDSEEEGYLIYESSVKTFNGYPELFVEAIPLDLFIWFSPRFRPEEFLKLYLKKIDKLNI